MVVYAMYLSSVPRTKKKSEIKINKGKNNQSLRTNPTINNSPTQHHKSQIKSQVVWSCSSVDGTELERSLWCLGLKPSSWITTICNSDCMYVWHPHTGHPRETSSGHWVTVPYSFKDSEGSFILTTAHYDSKGVLIWGTLSSIVNWFFGVLFC